MPVVSTLRDRPSHLHLDPLGGISGDMFIAALLDAWPEAWPGLERAIRAAGLPESWSVAVGPGRDGALTGARFAITAPKADKARPTGAYSGIVRMIEAAELDAEVGGRAIAILTLLAEAEAAVHGIPIGDVHFHELADWDSIADVIGAAYLIEFLRPASWSVGPLPLGRGRVDTAHGALPVPAPATAKLLQGFAVFDDGIAGERVTPTGAAILKHLAPHAAPPATPHLLIAEGAGFGSRQLPGLANALRVLGFKATEQDGKSERVAVLAFEVDDQTPEDLAIGLERLRALPGVLDVLQSPAFGKKGRVLAQIRLLARPEAVEAAIAACFHETTTIGLRWGISDRVVLARRQRPVGPHSVKVVDRPGGRRTAKAEIDEVAGEPGGQAERKRRRRKAEVKALDEDGDG